METFSGREYLEIDIANQYGLDGEQYEDRLLWFKQNEHQLEQLDLTVHQQPDQIAALYKQGIFGLRLTTITKFIYGQDLLGLLHLQVQRHQ